MVFLIVIMEMNDQGLFSPVSAPLPISLPFSVKVFFKSYRPVRVHLYPGIDS